MNTEYNTRADKITHIKETIFTDPIEAKAIITSRRNNTSIRNDVSDFLSGDIPDHFQTRKPICYLSRYLATPNFELLKVAAVAKDLGMSLVVGEDRKTKFVGNNELKRALGKFSVVTGETKRGDETYENFTIIDFSTAQGEALNRIMTTNHGSLVEVHHELLSSFSDISVEVFDESDWVDRNSRQDLLKQYEAMLALLCYHGIMFESYPPEEHDFLEDIVYPAFQAVNEKIGVKPLIIEHISDEEEVSRDWNAYPQECYSFLIKGLTK